MRPPWLRFSDCDRIIHPHVRLQLDCTKAIEESGGIADEAECTSQAEN